MHTEPASPSATGDPARALRIGAWTLVPALHELRHPEHGRRTLRPKLLLVLECLAEHPGRVVGREELEARVWGGLVVNEEALTRAVSELRTILGDDPGRPAYVQTIRGAGYRLVAPVREAGQRGPRRRRRVPELAAGAALLAVLLAGALRTLGDRAAEAPLLARPSPLTSFPGRETDPAVSPDGRLVAYSWGGADDANYDVYVQARAGGPPRRLSSHPDRDVHPAWSPDGQRLAWLRTGDAGASLWAARLDDGVPVHLADVGTWATGLDWSPDGRTLVLARTLGEGLHLATVRLGEDTGGGSLEPRPLTAPAGIDRDHSPAFSPDGSRVAFVRSSGSHGGGGDRIVVVALDGAELARFDMGTSDVRGLDWVADERRLVLSAVEDDTARLFRLDLESGDLAEVLLREEQATYPSLSEDGRVLVYEDARPEEKLWCLAPPRGDEPPAGADAARPFLATTRSESEAYFSPDGSRVAFVSDRGGTRELWLAEADGSGARCLTDPGPDRVARPRWAPDGRRIAFQRTGARETSLWLLEPDGADGPRRLHRDAAALLLAGWSGDGRALYFGSDRGGEWAVWRLAVDGSPGDPRLVLGDAADLAQESADGSWLYYSRVCEPGIWRRPVSGGRSELVVADFDPRLPDDWSLDGDQLLFTRTSSRGLSVQRLDCASGRLDALFEGGRLSVPSLSVSPRTGELLLATARPGAADLDLVELPAKGVPR